MMRSKRQSALGHFKSADDKSGEASAMIVKAHALKLKGNNAEGLKVAREALMIFHEAGDKKGEVLARETCALLRPKAEKKAPEQVKEPPLGVKKPMSSCVPGISGPSTLQSESCVSCMRLCGSAETKKLEGIVTVVTGASRGIGKGISEALAEA